MSNGRNYMGPKVSDVPYQQKHRAAACGLGTVDRRHRRDFLHRRTSSWVEAKLFVGGMREGEMSRTGQLHRIEFNDKWEEVRREPMLRELHQRIRDVRQGPDGLLYLVTAEAQGALLRIEPAPAPASTSR